MTFEEIKQSDKLFLLPTDVAQVLGCHPHQIRLAARDDPDGLGFPVTVIGSRTRIPRLPFIQYIEGRR